MISRPKLIMPRSRVRVSPVAPDLLNYLMMGSGAIPILTPRKSEIPG